jgi:hypothetical protein
MKSPSISQELLLRTSARATRGQRAARTFAVAMVLFCGGARLHAQAPNPDLKAGDLSSKYSVDEGDPEASLPTAEQAMKNPLEMGYLMMDLIARAEAASQRGDHAAAVRYYRAVAKAVPDRAVSFSKLCRAYKELGEVGNAIQACKEALGKGGVTVEDHASFVRLMLAKEEALTQAELDEVEAVILHLEEQLASEQRLLPAQLRCELATRVEDAARLKACVSTMQKLAPADPRTFTYRWALALQERDSAVTRKLIEEGQRAGLPAQALAQMEQKSIALENHGFAWSRLLHDWRWLGVIACYGVFLIVLGLFRRPKLQAQP